MVVVLFLVAILIPTLVPVLVPAFVPDVVPVFVGDLVLVFHSIGLHKPGSNLGLKVRRLWVFLQFSAEGLWPKKVKVSKSKQLERKLCLPEQTL